MFTRPVRLVDQFCTEGVMRSSTASGKPSRRSENDGHSTRLSCVVAVGHLGVGTSPYVKTRCSQTDRARRDHAKGGDAATRVRGEGSDRISITHEAERPKTIEAA